MTIEDINEVIEEWWMRSDIVDYGPLFMKREGFLFGRMCNDEEIKFDALVIKHPNDLVCHSPLILDVTPPLEECINLVNELKLEKALIVADNIDFIVRCPTLKYVEIFPASNAPDKFDYSPLYKMPEIKYVHLKTEYGYKESLTSDVDYSKIRGLERVHITNVKHQRNFNTIETLKSLSLSWYSKPDLKDAFSSTSLDSFLAIQCKIKSLDGIQKSKNMTCVYLFYNRSLRDISALIEVKDTLTALHIENCAKIENLSSVLGELKNLKYLRLMGYNSLENLNFLKKLTNLKTFDFNMNVLDGDLTPCLNIPYVHLRQNRKHYNLKDCDMPKDGAYVYGNESIDQWRRRRY